MTNGVVFYQEDSGSTFFNELTVWAKTAGVFGMDFLIIVDWTDGNLYKNWEDKSNFQDTKVVKTLNEAFAYIDENYPNHEIVYFDIDGDKTIGKNFTHPNDNVIYLFGADGGAVEPPRFDYHVKLDIPNEIWASQIFAIAMYDRGLK